MCGIFNDLNGLGVSDGKTSAKFFCNPTLKIFAFWSLSFGREKIDIWTQSGILVLFFLITVFLAARRFNFLL